MLESERSSWSEWIVRDRLDWEVPLVLSIDMNLLLNAKTQFVFIYSPLVYCSQMTGTLERKCD